MFCSNCGHEIPKDMTVCPNCGAPIYKQDQSTQPFDNQQYNGPFNQQYNGQQYNGPFDQQYNDQQYNGPFDQQYNDQQYNGPYDDQQYNGEQYNQQQNYQQDYNQYNQQQYSPKASDSSNDESKAVIGGICGFFLPVISILIALIFPEGSEARHTFIKGWVWGLIAAFIIGFIGGFFLLFI